MGNPSAKYHQANLARLRELNIDPYGDDDTVLGVPMVFCHQHCRPHETGWCTVSVVEKTPLRATERDEAYAEAREKGFYIDGEAWPCGHCGVSIISRGYGYLGYPTVDDKCSKSPNGHRMAAID